MNYETLTSTIQGGQEEINPVGLHDAHDLITYSGRYIHPIKETPRQP